MTKKLTKIIALTLATVTISTATISAMTPASANMMNRGMGGHGSHMHHHRGGHGFGGAAAAGLAIGLVGALIAAQAQQNAYAESYNPRTGERVRSEGRPGRHVVTRRNGDGKVVERKVVKPSPASASSTDPKTGITTTSISNGDGSRTVVTTSADGKVLSSSISR